MNIIINELTGYTILYHERTYSPELRQQILSASVHSNVSRQFDFHTSTFSFQNATSYFISFFILLHLFILLKYKAYILV